MYKKIKRYLLTGVLCMQVLCGCSADEKILCKEQIKETVKADSMFAEIVDAVSSEEYMISYEKLYDQIFQQYYEAISIFPKNGSEGFTEKFPYVSEFLVADKVEHGTPVWYGFYDIDGNGMEELFFSYATIEGYEYKIVDVFSHDGEQIQKVGEDDTFSEYTGSCVYNSGVIYSNTENQENYYRMNDDGYHLELQEKPENLGEEIKIDWKELEISRLEDMIAGFWYSADWNEGYRFYKDGRFERYHTSSDYSGVIRLGTLLEAGEYEIEKSQMLKLYPGGDRFSWQEFTYHAQDQTITNGIVYKKTDNLN